MPLSKTDLLRIDQAARLALERRKPSQRKPMDPFMPGPLNHERAFYMAEFLKVVSAPPAEVEAALRENWPADWRKNEEGNCFGDEWFSVLATAALKDHERKGTK